ncbi:DUF58 domain-containing protein [Planctomicrobium piriforme]|uniref:DUF58 domain-containing protein n=1 Tax=Planctomicrobium piriforme TaxID=1576369 RepID=UPI001FEA48DC|nr:DUF58 domain-containing protein [Planctomicrobium piriforme]
MPQWIHCNLLSAKGSMMASARSAPPVAGYPPASFIDPVTLMQIQSLELRAKAVVEGFFTGLHRSPYHGFSVEFTEYRQYVPGDDLRYLDWRLYARSDRYYIKRFEDETNLLCHLLVDNSRSMSYGSLPYTKADYGKTLAGTLAYFLHSQRDAVGLFRFSSDVDEYLPPRYRAGHLRRVLISLDQQPQGTSTGIVAALERVAEVVRRRGLFVLITDFLAPLDQLESRLGYLRATGNEVAAFQIVDPAELDFPFTESALFVDAETGREVYVDPQVGRKQYQQKFEKHQNDVAQCCERLGVQLTRLTTDTPLEQALAEFLRTRVRVTQTRRK